MCWSAIHLLSPYWCVTKRGCVLLQQAYHATTVIRQMQRMALGNSSSSPSKSPAPVRSSPAAPASKPRAPQPGVATNGAAAKKWEWREDAICQVGCESEMRLFRSCRPRAFFPPAKNKIPYTCQTRNATRWNYTALWRWVASRSRLLSSVRFSCLFFFYRRKEIFIVFGAFHEF